MAQYVCQGDISCAPVELLYTMCLHYEFFFHHVKIIENMKVILSQSRSDSSYNTIRKAVTVDEVFNIVVGMFSMNTYTKMA